MFWLQQQQLAWIHTIFFQNAIEFYLPIILHGMCETITGSIFFKSTGLKRLYILLFFNSIIHIPMFDWDTHLSIQNLNKSSKTCILCWTKSAYVLCKSLQCCMQYHINWLMQERRNSIANALELHLSCINPLILHLTETRLKLNEDNLMLGNNIHRDRWLEGSGCMTN